jgi:putative intracellular protease/amidase
VAAVCHGPVALLGVKLSDGKFLLQSKKVTSFTQEEEKAKQHLLKQVIPFMLDQALKQQGAIFSNEKSFASYVVVDGNLVTGQNPASATNVAQQIIKLLDK